MPRPVTLGRVARIIADSGGLLFIVCSDISIRRQLIKHLNGLPVTFIPPSCGIRGTQIQDLDEFFISPLTIPPVYVYNIDEAEQQPQVSRLTEQPSDQSKTSGLQANCSEPINNSTVKE